MDWQTLVHCTEDMKGKGRSTENMEGKEMSKKGIQQLLITSRSTEIRSSYNTYNKKF